MPKKKRRADDGILDIARFGITTQVGGLAVGTIAGQGNVHVQRIGATAQQGFGLASVAMPVMAGGIVLSSVKSLGKKVKI